MVFNTENVKKKLKKKAIGTYLKLINSLVKPVIPYACECWGDSQKKKFLQTKYSQYIQDYKRYS